MERLKNLNVLIVDDSATALFSLKLSLKKTLNEENIYTAEGYDEALDILNNKEIDVAIVDLEMPTKSNGVDLIVDMKKDEKMKNIPVIVVTGTEANSLLSASLGEMTTSYLHKPVEEAEIQAALLNSIKVSL